MSAAQESRERVGWLLTDGIERTPAQIARDLGMPSANVRTLLHRMAEAGQVATRGDSYYFGTDTTARQLAHRKVRRGPVERPVAPIVERHLAHLRKRGLRSSTIRQRRTVITRLELWLKSQGVELLDATPELLERFTDFARGNAGRKTAVRNVSGFYRWAVEREDLLDRSPARLLVLPRERPGLPRPMSEENLAQAVELAPEPIRTWLILAGWCGLRCMEIAPLNDRDVDVDGRRLIVRDGKGGVPRVQPAPPIVISALELHLGRGYLFQREDPPPGPVGADAVQQRANAFLHGIGIADTMHTARHRYGTLVYEHSGYDLIATQTLLGHRSIVSTVGYAAARPTDQLHDVVAMLPH